MDNNRNYRSVNGFTIIIFMVIVFGALWMANRMQMHRQEMTYTEFVKQVEAENVTEVYIDQNKAVPTGTVVFALKDTDENRSVNVSNVEKVEKLLDKNEVLYQVSAIPETSMLSSVLLPTVITLGGIMLLFFLMNRQGNGANAKAMNFGKSRARMTNHDEIKVTFANGAEVTMIPQTYVDLTSEEDIKNIQKTLDLLEEDDDVQDVYHNWNE